MSGTSIDSADFALCAVRDAEVRLQNFWQLKFPGDLEERLRAAARGVSACHEVARLHHDLGRFFAQAAIRGGGKVNPELVGLHGQTVFHGPGKKAATFQLGEPAYLVETLGVPVVSNFRAADLAAGGQGAPLATLFHQAVFGERGAHVCVNNLGGIGNVTSIDWRSGRSPRLLAFDTGPANMLMDLAVRHFSRGKAEFDENGAWARRGVVMEKVLSQWMRHPFLSRKPPKSTGREMFGDAFLEAALPRLEACGANRFDALATLAEFTARSLVLNYQLHLPSIPERVILAGGGAANGGLVRRIREQLGILNPLAEVVTCDQTGWPAQSIEPAAFALLAYYRFRGIRGNVPITTGARRACLLGQLSEP